MTPRTAVWIGSGCLFAAALLGLLVVTMTADTPNAVDIFWHDAMVSGRSDALIALSQVLNTVGRGWVAVVVVPVLLLVVLWAMRRYAAMVFTVAALMASAGLVQTVKRLFGRSRPEDLLVVSDFGSFPSGHSANAATVAFVLVVVFPRLWVALLGLAWTVAMMLSRTILAVHWLTDTVGGALLGAGATILTAALFTRWAAADLPWISWAGAGALTRRAAEPPTPDQSPTKE